MSEPRVGQAAPAAVAQPGTAALSLQAVFGGSQKPVVSGLEWRVFADGDGAEGRPFGHSTDANPTFRVTPGIYIVHVSYGLAPVVRRVTVGANGASELIQINAGGLILKGAIADTPLTGEGLTFTIFLPLNNRPEGKLIAQGVRSGELVRLPEGSYHVVSNYGGTNAIRRADIKVESGIVTTATIHHRAATVVLKLVLRKGGEAVAGTAFTVLTPGGDTIHEATGAFPQVTLAEGEYLLIARNAGKVHTQSFKVESGRNTDAEVLATD
jgi:hypothetical protein